MHIKLGSRQSHLAQKQAYMVKALLEEKGHSVELYLKPSFGDLNLDIDLSKTEEKGVFTSDFTKLLHDKKVDCVVHSWKDLPIELSGATDVVATLKREDSRDLFIVKKTALQKKDWCLLTSSPRREFHIKKFFDYLQSSEVEASDKSEECDTSFAFAKKKLNISFKAIRGNIPTRFKKFLEDNEADGFCVALAAVKRLVNDKSFNSDYPGLWLKLLKTCEWCVLPESLCPSAAAQGALALEVLTDRKDLIKALQEINHESDKQSVIEERVMLKKYGGGCHLAIGTQVFKLKRGDLKINSGYHNGESFHDIEFVPPMPYPKKIEKDKLWISTKNVKAVRTKDYQKLESKNSSILVTRKESYSSVKDQEYSELFTSGVKTWRALFKKGTWVNGCLDSLGADYYPKDIFSKGIDTHYWLTRSGVEGPIGFETLSTYDLSCSVKTSSFDGCEYFVWMSGELLLDSLKKYPELRNKIHFLGLGRSFDKVEYIINKGDEDTFLKKGVNLFAFYNIKQITKSLLKG